MKTDISTSATEYTGGELLSPLVPPYIGHLNLSAFALRETVYLVTDYEQKARIITSICFRGSGAVVYTVNCGIEESMHYDFELSREENILKKTQ